jgi:YebC/PmpR family DNA-binding regulatory protein
MAGHSKWAQIKRSKAVKDTQRGALFARFSREITVAAKIGGPDPEGNFRLRTAIERAKAALLPNDNIRRAIEKATGGGAADQLESVAYEGYGPGGVAVFIETMTDNRNRTAGDIRSYFNKYNGNLGYDGCVAWVFEQKGVIRLDAKGNDEDVILEKALEAGAMDVSLNEDDGQWEITTEPLSLNTVCDALTADGIKIASAEVTRIPQNSVRVTDQTHAKQLMKLLDAIESQEDVQAVFANFEMDDALLQQISD